MPIDGSEVRALSDVLPTASASLRHEFPDLSFAWRASSSSLQLDIESVNGARDSAHVGYPLDLEYAAEAARLLAEADEARDRVADRLVEWNVGGYTEDAGHAPYILRWLVFRQQVNLSHTAVVLYDEDQGRLPWPASMTGDIQTIAEDKGVVKQQLRLFVDGAARLVRPHPGLLPTALGRTIDLDLTTVSLQEFQDLWLGRDDQKVATAALDLAAPHDSRSVEEQVAVDLLATYAGAMWLRHDDFQRDVIDASGRSPRVRWDAASQLSMIASVATLQDRGVLAVVCHLSNEVARPHVPLVDALHYVGDARTLVLECLGRVSGRHPDPGAYWPTDCSPPCP